MQYTSELFYILTDIYEIVLNNNLIYALNANITCSILFLSYLGGGDRNRTGVQTERWLVPLANPFTPTINIFV